MDNQTKPVNFWWGVERWWWVWVWYVVYSVEWGMVYWYSWWRRIMMRLLRVQHFYFYFVVVLVVQCSVMWRITDVSGY